MRFLANENVPLDAIVSLREKGHDVIWIRIDVPGSCDEDILSRAVAEERIVITFDKDFGELAFHSCLPSHSIEYQQFNFKITAKEPIILPAYKGSTPHGGFGYVF